MPSSILHDTLQCGNKCIRKTVILGHHSSSCPHLVVEEHVDDRVDDGAELGQDGGHNAGRGSHQFRPAEGGHQRHDAVGHPAQHVAGHHGQHHHQDVLLSALSCQQIDLTHLEA